MPAIRQERPARSSISAIRQLEGDYAGAEPELRESLRLFRQLGDALGEAHALHYARALATATGVSRGDRAVREESASLARPG